VDVVYIDAFKIHINTRTGSRFHIHTIMTSQKQDYTTEESHLILPMPTAHSHSSTLSSHGHQQEQKAESSNSISSTITNDHLSDSENEEEEEEGEPKKLTRMEKLKEIMIYARPLALMLFIDAGLPLAIYYLCKQWLSQLVALIISGIPPLLRVIYVFWKKRHIDMLGCIFVIAFVLSAVLSIISGDIRLAMLRDSTVTAVVSLMFLVTLIPLRTRWFTIRPLIFLISQQMMAGLPPTTWIDANGEKHEMDRMEWVWKYCPIYRKYCYILCAIWGILLMAEFAAKVIMIQSTLSVDQIVLYGNIMVIVVVVVMTIGTIVASREITKRIDVIAKQWTKENDFTVKKRKNRSNQQHDVYTDV
jgi:hypothetical protein